MLNVAIRMVRKAGKVVLDAADNIKKVNIYKKSNSTYVTDVDIKVEEVIISDMQCSFGNHFYITEESGSFGNINSDYIWIIDPIDGTSNFIHSIPHSCTSVAMQFRGEVILAAVYNPHLDHLFISEKGSGAMLNGTRMRGSQRTQLKYCLLSGNTKYNCDIFCRNYIISILNLQKTVLGVRYSGSLALDMCYAASGYLDGLWLARNSNIWDYSATALIMKESGNLLHNFKNTAEHLNDSPFMGGNSKVISNLIDFFIPYLK
jgi:myo-inositol-1(or 4)-monophosphatase